MKKSYSPPKLVCHGDVAAITQVLGKLEVTDFVFNAGGESIGGDNDLGSVDITLP